MRSIRINFTKQTPIGDHPAERDAHVTGRQAVRTRKWRKAHPEKNRAIRRQQYRRSKAAELGLSRRAAIKIAKPRRRSPN